MRKVFPLFAIAVLALAVAGCVNYSAPKGDATAETTASANETASGCSVEAKSCSTASTCSDVAKESKDSCPAMLAEKAAAKACCAEKSATPEQ